MTTQIFDTKRAPYFDDFDSSKNFVNILFKPGVPVQARELNQLQSIQHHHLSKFGEHVFKHGSMIEGQGPAKIECPFIVLKEFDGFADQVDYDKIRNAYRLHGAVSGVEAEVVMVTDYNRTVYIRYSRGGDDGSNTFLEGEVIYALTSPEDTITETSYYFFVKCPSCAGTTDPFEPVAKGTGTLWTIPDGVYFVYGYFIEFSSVTIVAEPFSINNYIYDVGFEVITDIVDAVSDNTLYDNTLGYPNYNAPGADRGRIRLGPVIRYEEYAESKNFIPLAKCYRGTIEYIKLKTEYADLMKMIAERTYDESGNYTVKPFRVNLQEHLLSEGNGGYLTEAQGGSSDKFMAMLSEGKAYVQGYQVERVTNTYLECEKARDTKKVRNFYTQLGGLGYVLIKPTLNSFCLPSDISMDSVYGNLIIELYDDTTEGGFARGEVIGTMKAYDAEVYEFTESPDEPDIYKLYYTEITMNSGKKYQDVKSMNRSGTIFFNADVVVDELTGRPKVYGNNETSLVWKIHDAIKSMRDVDDNTKRNFTFSSREKFFCTLDADGTFSWNSSKGVYFSPINPLTSLAAFVDDTGVVTSINLTNQISVTPERMTADFGSDCAGKKMVLIHTVIKSSAHEKKKTIVRQVDASCTVDADGYIALSKSDLSKLISIERFSTGTPATLTSLEASTYSIDNGMRDQGYVHSNIILNEVPTSFEQIRYKVTYDYYEHGPGEFFSVDSYKDLIDDPNIDYDSGSIPVYKSKNKVTYNLSDCVDFRPLILDDDPILIEQPALGGQVITDLEYYLPRIDLIVVNKNGVIFQMKGVSDETPKPPKVASDGSEMAIYELHQAAYARKASSDIRLKYIENKRYTMRDIGKLETRLKNVEYYTVLSMIELSLSKMSVTDEFGFDRFKNGFVVDNFQDFQAANIESLEFKASVDRKEKTLRPEFSLFESGFEVDSSGTTNFKQMGDVLILDYDQEKYITQPYASKPMSVNPYFIFEKKGNMVLEPAFDSWSNSNNIPPLTVDATVGELPADSKASIDWGSWEQLNSNAGNLGEYVTDVTYTPYMRETVIKFNASGLIANTTFFPTFDDINVAAHCRSTSTADSPYGSTLVSDNSGNLSGEFKIPASTFFVGQKVFRLSNHFVASSEIDTTTSTAEAKFFSGGVDFDVQQKTLNITSPISPVPPPAPKPIIPKPGATEPSTTDSDTLNGFFFLIEAAHKFGIPCPVDTKPVVTSEIEAVNRMRIAEQYILGFSPSTFDCGTVALTGERLLAEDRWFDSWKDLPIFGVPEHGGPATDILKVSRGPLAFQSINDLTTGNWGKDHAARLANLKTLLGNVASQYGKTIDLGSLNINKKRAGLPKYENYEYLADGRWLVNTSGFASTVIDTPKTQTITANTSGNKLCYTDPLAQSFINEADCFATSVDLYFKTVSPADNVFAQIVTMMNGYPTTEVLGEMRKGPVDIAVSADGSVATQFIFPFPIFLKGSTEYAVVVGGTSPDTAVWVSNLGEKDSVNDTTIETQPSLGSLFKSQNSSTWTASQYEDLKFNLYRARFKNSNGTVVLKNKPYRDDTFISSPFETESGSSSVRIHCENHGMSSLDQLTPSLVEGATIKITVDSGTVCIGQTLTTSTGSGLITSVSLPFVNLKNIRGYFTEEQTYSTNSITIKNDSYLTGSYLSIPTTTPAPASGTPSTTPAPASTAPIVSGAGAGLVKTDFRPLFNGLTIDVLNKTLDVTSVDSGSSFIVNVGTAATETGRIGGPVIINASRKYDVFNISGDYLDHNAEATWTFTGIGHSMNGLFGDDDELPMPAIPFKFSENFKLTQPFKYSNKEGITSLKIKSSFTTPNTLVSPILNVNTFSLIGISNVIDFNEESTYNCAPNSAGRYKPETDPTNGVSTFKYVTKVINLTNSALDMRFFLDVSKPEHTDFSIYTKVRAPNENTEMDLIPWNLVKTYTDSDFINQINEFTEIELNMSEDLPTLFDGLFEFNVFAFKIVGRSKNSATPPQFQLLRIIAVT